MNPLAHASVTPERIDQGVDYAGTGTLTSIGKARVTYVAVSGSGWPGAFIEYQLLNGPYACRYVYYAEGVRPASGIYVGRIVNAGPRRCVCSDKTLLRSRHHQTGATRWTKPKIVAALQSGGKMPVGATIDAHAAPNTCTST